jgi:hypothetical protein
MFVTKTPILIAATLLSTFALSADDVPSVKGIFLSPQHPTTLGARFHIVLEKPNGGKVNVPSSYEFHSGDRFWLEVEARTSSFVYVINRTLSGTTGKALEVVRDEDASRTPPPSEQPHLVFGPEKVEPGKFRQVPKSVAMAFDNVTGIEKLYVVLSPTRIPELDQNFGPEGSLSGPDKGANALKNLDKAMAGWSKQTKQAIPVATKGVVLDEPDGYSVQDKPGVPLIAEITLTHSAR